MKLHHWEYNKRDSEYNTTSALFDSLSKTEITLWGANRRTFRNLSLLSSHEISVHSVHLFMHDQWVSVDKDNLRLHSAPLKRPKAVIPTASTSIAKYYRILSVSVRWSVLELYLTFTYLTTHHQTSPTPSRGKCKGDSY
jgi:hypothetical protein